MRGKLYIVTGASGSMGSEAVRSLAAEGAAVIMACRSLRKGEAVRQSLLKELPDADLRLKKLDLTDFDSILAFTGSLAEAGVRVDGLFNNAGIINRDYKVDGEGMELTLKTNYLGPALLTRLMLPILSDDARIVNMVSLTCRFGNISEDFFHRGKEKFSQLGTYSDTKLALMLFSISLQERLAGIGYPGIAVNVADPGIVNSNMISMGRWFDPLADIFFRPFCSSPAKGVAPALRALRSESSLHLFKGRSRKGRSIPARYTAHPLKEWLWNETFSKLKDYA